MSDALNSSDSFNSSGSSATAIRPSIFNQPESSSHAKSQSRVKHSYSYEPRPVFSHIVEPRERGFADADPPDAIPATEFDPPERITAMILSDLSRDDTSLGSIASSAGTTVEALTLWMSRPDIAHRLAALEAGLAQRVRVVCANYSAAVLSSCGRILKEYNEAESAFNSSMSSFESRVVSCRNRATVIEAGKLLLRFNAAYTPAAPRPSRARSSPPSNTASQRAQHDDEENPSPELAPCHGFAGASPATRACCNTDITPTTPAPDLRSLRASRFPAPATEPAAHESLPHTPEAPADAALTSLPIPSCPAVNAPSASSPAHKYPAAPASSISDHTSAPSRSHPDFLAPSSELHSDLGPATSLQVASTPNARAP